MQTIKRLIKDTFTIQRKADELTALAKTNMVKIQEHFDNENISELSVDEETDCDTILIAKKSERVTVDYFADKLQQKLDKDIFNEIIHKQYKVIDMQGLISLLRKSGVNPSDFKKFINVEQSVDRAALKRLYETGDIKKDDIKGCFSAKVVKSVKITQKQKDG